MGESQSRNDVDSALQFNRASHTFLPNNRTLRNTSTTKNNVTGVLKSSDVISVKGASSIKTLIRLVNSRAEDEQERMNPTMDMMKSK